MNSDGSSYAAASGGVVVVGRQYCAPVPVGLNIHTRRNRLKRQGNIMGLMAQVESFSDLFEVRDGADKLMFQIKADYFNKLIQDPVGNTLLTLKSKTFSLHSTWKVFRGKSTNSSDLIFTAKWSSFTMLKGRMKVYLAGNTDGQVCDFNVEDNDSDRPCTIYAGESTSDVVAKMHRSVKAAGMYAHDEKYTVTVFPNVDQLFVTAVFAILGEMKAN